MDDTNKFPSRNQSCKRTNRNFSGYLTSSLPETLSLPSTPSVTGRTASISFTTIFAIKLKRHIKWTTRHNQPFALRLELNCRAPYFLAKKPTVVNSVIGHWTAYNIDIKTFKNSIEYWSNTILDMADTSQNRQDEKSYIPLTFYKNHGINGGTFLPENQYGTRLHDFLLMNNTFFGPLWHSPRHETRLHYKQNFSRKIYFRTQNTT